MPPKKMYTALKAKKGLDLSKSHHSEESMCYHTHSFPNESIYCVVRSQYIDSSGEECVDNTILPH